MPCFFISSPLLFLFSTLIYGVSAKEVKKCPEEEFLYTIHTLQYAFGHDIAGMNMNERKKDSRGGLRGKRTKKTMRRLHKSKQDA